MSVVKLIFPHQLFPEHPLLLEQGRKRAAIPVYLVEEWLYFRQYSFHKQKLAFHRATMQTFAATLGKKGFKVEYIPSTDPLSDIRELLAKLQKEGVKEVQYVDTTDNWLEKRIAASGLERTVFESPLFLNSRAELADFFRADKKKFFQTKFYVSERKKREVLIDQEEKPIGGKWSFDAENRKKYPRNKIPPRVEFPASSAAFEEARAYVLANFPNNPGTLGVEPLYPIDRPESQAWFQAFLQERFSEFGAYEDAIVSDQAILNHSVLTPMLNVGLLSPEEVLYETVAFARRNDIPLNSTEGFVRQIMGWREFIRGVYEAKGSYERTRNFWGFNRKIPASFYDGTTGIQPLDTVIKRVLETGYCHHIERLMVVGNFLLLCEFDPDEVYRWFMELFIDAYDWVMVPNVYGMSQFADGGLMSTKPYISGGNYLLKMSNFKKGLWQATWDGLFWRFMHVHRSFFLGNPRLSMLIRSFDKMSADKRNAHLAEAGKFLAELDEAVSV